MQPKYTTSRKRKMHWALFLVAPQPLQAPLFSCSSEFWCFLRSRNTQRELFWMLWIGLRWQRGELYWKRREKTRTPLRLDWRWSTSACKLFTRGIAHWVVLVPADHGGVHFSAQRSGWKHHQRRPGAAQVGVQRGHPRGPERQHHFVQRVVQLPGEERQAGPRWDSEPPQTRVLPPEERPVNC